MSDRVKESSNPSYSLWVKHENGYSSDLEPFSCLNDACNFASKHFAQMYGLKGDKFYLQWDEVLRDATYTRIWQSKDGEYRIVVDKIG